MVQLSFPYAVLELSPGFISEQHREAASKEAKATLLWLSISPNPARTTGDSIAGPLMRGSLPRACQAHAPCRESPLGTGEPLECRESVCTSGSDAHVPTVHMAINNSPCSSVHHRHHNSTHHKHQPLTCGGDNLLHKDTSSL